MCTWVQSRCAVPLSGRARGERAGGAREWEVRRTLCPRSRGKSSKKENERRFCAHPKRVLDVFLRFLTTNGPYDWLACQCKRPNEDLYPIVPWHCNDVGTSVVDLVLVTPPPIFLDSKYLALVLPSLRPIHASALEDHLSGRRQVPERPSARCRVVLATVADTGEAVTGERISEEEFAILSANPPPIPYSSRACFIVSRSLACPHGTSRSPHPPAALHTLPRVWPRSPVTPTLPSLPWLRHSFPPGQRA